MLLRDTSIHTKTVGFQVFLNPEIKQLHLPYVPQNTTSVHAFFAISTQLNSLQSNFTYITLKKEKRTVSPIDYRFPRAKAKASLPKLIKEKGYAVHQDRLPCLAAPCGENPRAGSWEEEKAVPLDRLKVSERAGRHFLDTKYLFGFHVLSTVSAKILKTCFGKGSFAL